MSKRRQARGKTAAGADLHGNPNHSRQESFEHPVFGHVRIWFRGNEMYRIKWSSPDYGQNDFLSHYAERFAKIRQKLGIDD